MAREKAAYREQYEIMLEKINNRFPDHLGFLTADQVASILNVRLETVYNYSKAKKNRDPIPCKKIGPNISRYPIAAFIRWSLG